MTLELLVALRYLRSKHRPAVLRLITALSVLGVGAGVTTLVVALAMNSGFRQVMRDRLLGVTAHVNLKPRSLEGISNYRELTEQLASTPGVRSITPALYDTVLLSSGGRARGIVLKGIDPALEERSDDALHHIVSGTLDFSPDADRIPEIVVGKLLAEEIQVRPGDYITLTSPQGSLTPFGMLPRSKRFRVAGIFDSGFYDYDANWCFVTLASAQDLAGVGDVASLLEIRVEKLEDAPAVAQAILSRAGKGFETTTWMEENRALFRALSLEKLVTAIFIGLITFVAGLNILVVLTMTVTDKARDIAILVAMGARRAQVRNVFILQGLIVGIVGTTAGLGLGYTFAGVADHWKIIPLDPAIYSVPFVPFRSNPMDAVWIAAAALAITVGATLLPARAAARILPVEILRYE
ncbi:MAG: ABC transporter permease [Candidatus Acidiferrales bacterium]